MTEPSVQFSAALTCHPETRSRAVQGIGARVGWTQEGALALAYVVTGNIARLRISPARSPRRTDRLWQHTCFEAFVAVQGAPEYCELNFAPSGEWAAYSFQSYRVAAPFAQEGRIPKITLRRSEEALELGATAWLDRLHALAAPARLRLGLSAVIEEEPGMLSYWALKHPPGRPDFHHPDNFNLELEPPCVKDANELAVEKR
jgi:hypothetical protein